MDNRKESTMIDTEYHQYIKKCFRQGYDFLVAHANPRTDDDWERIAESIDSFTDEFAIDLAAACETEHKRKYYQHKKIGVGT